MLAIAYIQGRREPNVGPGLAQIWRISGFVNSKTDGENPALLSELWCDLQKKNNKVFTKILAVFPVEIRWSTKKKVSGLHIWFFSVISMTLFWSPRALCWVPWSQRPHHGPPWSPWAPSLAPKVYGSRGHCLLCPPPLGGPAYIWINCAKIVIEKLLVFSITV